jgi:hypothetical protein
MSASSAAHERQCRDLVQAAAMIAHESAVQPLSQHTQRLKFTGQHNVLSKPSIKHLREKKTATHIHTHYTTIYIVSNCTNVSTTNTSNIPNFWLWYFLHSTRGGHTFTDQNYATAQHQGTKHQNTIKLSYKYKFQQHMYLHKQARSCNNFVSYLTS